MPIRRTAESPSRTRSVARDDILLAVAKSGAGACGVVAIQKETGLTLAKFELDTVFTVNFANRSDVSEKELPVDAGPASISPSGKQLPSTLRAIRLHNFLCSGSAVREASSVCGLSGNSYFQS